MKKTIYSMGVILFILGIQTRGQDRPPKQIVIDSRYVETNNLYIKAALGVSFGLDPAILNQTTSTTGESTSTIVTEAIKARLGSGIPIEVATGFKFSKHFAVELGIDYNLGFSTKVNNVLNGDNTKITVKASTLSVIPSLVAQFQAGQVIPYVRVGPEIAVVNNYRTLTVGLVSTFKTTGSTGERDTRDYGGIAIGIKAAAGVEYPITKLVSIFGEVQARAISFFPKHGKVTKYTVDGADQLSTLGTKQAKWDYVKSVNYSDQISNDQPNQFLRVNHAVSNVGLVVGVKVNFGK
jgi:Outer membrane protein beta-barrel domain